MRGRRLCGAGGLPKLRGCGSRRVDLHFRGGLARTVVAGRLKDVLRPITLCLLDLGALTVTLYLGS